MRRISDLLKRSRQRGQSILMVALALPIFMFVLAIVFDLGVYFVQASKLQNIADSAALAGVSVYANKTQSNLIAKPTEDFDDSFTRKGNVSGYEYSFDPIGDKADADAKADDYIKTNSNDEINLEANGESGLWYAPYTTTLVDGSKATYNGIYVYRVDLKDEVPLNFAKYFGFDWFDIKASATALAYYEPDPELNIDDLIKSVNANIYKTAPNYYWQTIYQSSSTKKYTITKTNSETGEKSTEYGQTYGAQNDLYFTADINKYLDPKNELSSTNDLVDSIIAWKDGEDKFCAEPVTGTDKIGIKALVYTINRSLIQEKSSTGKETTSLFIDRPNTDSGAKGTPFREIDIVITGEHLSDDKDTPLYMRVESEPIIVGDDVQLVQPVVVTIAGDQEKPMVVAYDGPDPHRKNENNKRPSKHVPAVDINTGVPYQWNGSKWVRTTSGTYSGTNYSNFTWSFPDGASNLVYTSEIASAPFTVNLNHDFRGVIYAPYSKVIVYGPGAIDGFIMAAEVEDHGTSGTRKSHTTHSIIPNWEADYDTTYQTNATNWFKYNVIHVESDYSVIYDSFTNYTWTDLGAGVS